MVNVAEFNQTENCAMECEEGEELEEVEGECCPVCKPVCRVAAAPQQISIDGCVSEGTVDMGSCSGTCPSGATMTAEAPYMSADCTCCKPAAMVKMAVTLTCTDGQTITRNVIRIQSCSCSGCAFDPFAIKSANEILITPSK